MISIGLITAAALIPAKPVPRPAPIPAKKVTIIIKNNDDIIYIPPCFAKQNATAHVGAEVFASFLCTILIKIVWCQVCTNTSCLQVSYPDYLLSVSYQ